MSLQTLMARRLESRGPIRVGLIGAGKFGSMFLSQVPTSTGIDVTVIADLDVARARGTCEALGWSKSGLDAVRYVEDGAALAGADDVDVVVEATGDPGCGVRHARAAFSAGKPIIMVNVEADCLLGPMLAREAETAGVVYSMAYGDQPALVCELVDWARSCGFDVVAAGKGTRYLPSYHSSTPDTVWDHYGLSATEAEQAGMRSQMFNSFLDGTKSAIEMAAIANATGLTSAPQGLQFPPCGTDELASVLIPRKFGGQLHHKGQVEVVASEHRDASPVSKDLRWGVYVVVEASNDYTAGSFRQYGMLTDGSGRFAAMYKPNHLIGLELNVSILSAVLRGESTGTSNDFRADVVATAKRALRVGETLDGEGGYTVWGKLMPAGDSLALGGLPIGLARGVRLVRDIAQGEPIRWADVSVDASDEIIADRRRMEDQYRQYLGVVYPSPVKRQHHTG